MRRATPLGVSYECRGSKESDSTPDSPTNPTSEPKTSSKTQTEGRTAKLEVIRGNAPSPHHRASGAHVRRNTPVRATVQPSDPERLHRALEAMRDMNKLTRQRTIDLRRLSVVSRELSQQMTEFGKIIGNLKVDREKK